MNNIHGNRKMSLPPITGLNQEGGVDFKRVTSVKHVDLSNLAHEHYEEDQQYFEKSSVGENTLVNRAIGEQFSSRISNNIDQQSAYHLDLLEEKREEIQQIIKKRQRKAALISHLKQSELSGKPTMTGYIGRSKGDSIVLPDITTQRQRPVINVEFADLQDTHTSSLLGEEYARKLRKFDAGLTDSSIAVSQRQPGAFFDPNDTAQKQLDQLEMEVNEKAKQKHRVTLKNYDQKETRPQGQPELETMKRAFRQINKKQHTGVDAEEKHAYTVAKVTSKISKKLEDKKNNSASPNQKLNRSPSKQKKEEPRHEETSLEKQQTAISNVLEAELVSHEFELMTEDYIKKTQKKDSSKHEVFKSPKILMKDKGKDVTESHTQKSPSSLTKKSKKVDLSPRSPSGSRLSTPNTSVLSGAYKKMEGLMDHATALRIQKMIKKTKREQEQQAHKEAQKKLLDLQSSKLVIIEEETVADSSIAYEKQKREEFNSELELYSDFGSDGKNGSPGRRGGRRGTLTRAPTIPMPIKIVVPEESEMEKTSKDGSNEGSEQQEREGNKDGEDVDYSEDEENDNTNRASAMNERKQHKKDIEIKQQKKKEELELCGPRLTKKIDEFIFSISVEAGLADTNAEEFKNNGNTSGGGQNAMLMTGNTSIFRMEKTKNNDQGVYQKVMEKYADEFRGEQAFYQICKIAKDSRFNDQNQINPRVQYYNECTKANAVAKPILSKIIDKQLVIRDILLNVGDSKGLQDNLMYNPDLINKLYLDSNGLDSNQLADICEGLCYQKELFNLTIQGNSLNENTVEHISKLLKRKVPDNLQELHLIHVKCVWTATEALIRSVRQKNYLRKLSLIEASLNDFSMVHLCEVVRTQKTLTSLDISWNQLMPVQMKPLLEILASNRRLTNLNLSWNNIMEVAKDDDPNFQEHVEDVTNMLGKIIKHSKTIQHINLTGTGLSKGVIYELGNCLRRSRAVLCIHLSGNPGLTQDNMAHLNTRIRCRQNEDIERYIRIQKLVKTTLQEAGSFTNAIAGIKVKIERDLDFNQVHKKNPIDFSVNDQLIFQRMLGHKKDQPGSGQWYESSKNAVACKSHYKNECWYCEGHVYSIIFWSKAKAYKLNPILSKEKTEIIRQALDFDFGPQEETDRIYSNANLKYSQLENQVPYLCGSFTGWRYIKMISLEEFNKGFQTEIFNPFDVASQLGQLRKNVMTIDKCNPHEKRYIEIAILEEKLRNIYSWRHFFNKNLRYKRPFTLNSHLYYERPSKDGTLPEEELNFAMGDVLSDTSDDSDGAKEEKKETEEPTVKFSAMTREELEAYKQALAEKIRNPIPALPDVTKFEKVFILPLFLKPGKHNYMIKYKDTSEPRQAHLLKRIVKQEKRYRRVKNDETTTKLFDKIKYREAKKELNPECFFYQCEVPKRAEEVPQFAKTMESKVVERQFDKDSSVFSKWRQDSVSSVNMAFSEDIKRWKGYRFIKTDEERVETEAVLKKYYPLLKDCFVHVAANSSWPNIGSLDFCDFATKAKFLDSVVNISTVDRTYIAATLKVAETTAIANGLQRFEFLEILVRLAMIKYLETKVVKLFPEAIEKLIVECIIPYFVPEPWQEFRDKYLWTIEVNDLLEANKANLEKIYNNYKTATKPKPEVQDCIQMCMRDANLNVSEKDISFSFGLCHMTVMSEERQFKQYQSLEFVEFLEFIGRLAHQRFKGSSPESASQSLATKIEFILDDLCQGFGLIRQEVNIEVEEISESDEDY